MAVLRELALFAGAGGGLLASRLLGWRTVAAVEIDKYCQRVLLQRQRDGMLDRFPIWDDVRTFDGRPWRGRVDVVTAGFPCQPFSHAGKLLGAKDPRNLWPQTIRVIRQVKPRWCFLENSAALVTNEYIRTIFGQLAEARYDCRWTCLSAAEAGAWHKRDRVWIVAYPNAQSARRLPKRAPKKQSRSCDRGTHGANANGVEYEGGSPAHGRQAAPIISENADRIASDSWWRRWRTAQASDGWWSAEPNVGRVAYGVANGLDRHAAIGNGIVPIVAVRAWHELSEPFD